jgi:hypothetical protein
MMSPETCPPRCPRCGDDDVRSSHRQLLLVSLVGLRYYRCLACYKRFLGRRKPPVRRSRGVGDAHAHP